MQPQNPDARDFPENPEISAEMQEICILFQQIIPVSWPNNLIHCAHGNHPIHFQDRYGTAPCFHTQAHIPKLSLDWPSQPPAPSLDRCERLKGEWNLITQAWEFHKLVINVYIMINVYIYNDKCKYLMINVYIYIIVYVYNCIYDTNVYIYIYVCVT